MDNISNTYVYKIYEYMKIIRIRKPTNIQDVPFGKIRFSFLIITKNLNSILERHFTPLQLCFDKNLLVNNFMPSKSSFWQVFGIVASLEMNNS